MEADSHISQTMVSIQSNMQAHDDLAALFSRNLTFNPDIRAATPKDPPQLDPVAISTPAQPIIYSVSQHYHHSAHNIKPQPVPDAPQRPSSEPPRGNAMPSETILRNHGINPANLTPSQLQLFRIADAPQQRRLLELWSICPPAQSGDIPSLAWSSTTLEQEEHLARVRYEKQQDQTMSLDGTVVQSSNGHWHQQPEPYMTSGYEELMRREQERQEREMLEARARDNSINYGNSATYVQATDPVYMGPDYTRQQQQLDMASQYGAFEHFRGADEVSAMDMM